MLDSFISMIILCINLIIKLFYFSIEISLSNLSVKMQLKILNTIVYRMNSYICPSCD